ncbi:MAG: FAD:protein FMN transferase [Betaproteobacteria bacterium]|nr:FAD:protein FMN transferase [Betaproteobacteria bacterium]
MAGIAEVQLHAAHPDDARGAFAAAQVEVERIEAKYSRYRDDSALTAINRAAGGAPVVIDAETAALLDYADACWRQSGGLFDITSGVLRRVWDFKRGTLPDPAALESALARIGWERVRRGGGTAAGRGLSGGETGGDSRGDSGSSPGSSPGGNPTGDSRGGTIALEAGMEIDFGGIGKEYAADRAAAAAGALGIRHGLVNLGGDLRIIGAHPDGRPWQVGIAHPRSPGHSIAHVPLREGGLATSGDYERFFVRDSKRYCHILDPRTGWPVDGPQAVSVIAPLCTVAGSCATIAMLKGDGAEEYLREQGLPYLLVDREGTVSGTLTSTIP